MLPQQGNDLKSDRTFLSGPTVFHSSTLKANLHAAICRPRQIRERIGACEWRSDARSTSIRQVGRFRKICDCFTDFRVSGRILRTKTQPAKEWARNKLYLRYLS